MAEQRRDKVNGVGKLNMAGKKRRKGQDLQPIQTVPLQQNGVRDTYTGSTAMAPNQKLDYLSRYVFLAPFRVFFETVLRMVAL